MSVCGEGGFRSFIVSKSIVRQVLTATRERALRGKALRTSSNLQLSTNGLLECTYNAARTEDSIRQSMREEENRGTSSTIFATSST
ncbi:unnamed protein product [Calypogeia fissa]